MSYDKDTYATPTQYDICPEDVPSSPEYMSGKLS